jgi:hypothetical protein
VLLPSVLLLQEHMERNAADTIPTHRATRGFSGGYRALGDRRAYHSSGARCRLPSLAGTNAPGADLAPEGRNVCSYINSGHWNRRSFGTSFLR